MSDRFSEKNDSRKLAHAYVSLALAKDVANGYVSQQPAHAILHPLLTMLDVTARLLEEVLENVLPDDPQDDELRENSTEHDPLCSDMMM